ncbi:Hypothetical predicted protein [Podarcis lilfordi]|uniref:Uncharacterized protein n=1 Tax=Podarcis lilfordi TaxID=74358 RepID=A0AA35KXL8_9SAUR|nr:Hypothetical predicted protein [Podarcis lilfordi]
MQPERSNEVAPLQHKEQPVASGGGSQNIKEDGHPEEGRSAHRDGGIRPSRGAIGGAQCSRRCHRLRKNRKVAPLQREKKLMPPVVLKLFETLPKPEKAMAQRHQSRIQPAPEEEDITVEDIE